ncbi:hypothetical protein [Massilia aerilata]|uniref:Uncharacterized protein n=1 Tax=Massilia aerilata TaxID=453817 RepID=A0ABW0S5N0_9BURK
MSRQFTARTRTAALGNGELHQALEHARNRATLNRFCSAHVCTPAEVSEDGVRMHLPHVLQLMRNRGYQVADPIRAPHQPKRGFTAWMVHIRMPRVEFDVSFYTPDSAKSGPARKSHPSSLEHA